MFAPGGSSSLGLSAIDVSGERLGSFSSHMEMGEKEIPRLPPQSTNVIADYKQQKRGVKSYVQTAFEVS